MKDNEKRGTVKEAATDFGNETTIHGLQYVVNGTHFLYRLCWMAICVTFFAIFVSQAVVIYRDFIKYPYATKIDIVTLPSLSFPAVTVCNANRMRRSQLVDTRFEGLIELDGGISGADYDYSWWFSQGFIAAYGSSASSSSSLNSSVSESSSVPPTPASSSGGTRKKRSLPGESSLKNLAERFSGIPGETGVSHKSGDTRDENGRQHSVHIHGHEEQALKRSRRGAFSSSSAGGIPVDFSWYNSFRDDDFQYYDDGWDAVTGGDDWQGFYANSNADDYSDLIDVINPTKEEMENYGHQRDDFILQCTFDRRTCNISNVFTTWQNRYFGNCFTFNSVILNQTSPINTGKTGGLNGLHLTLFVEQPEYLGLLSPQTGAKVSIHHPNSLPFPEDDAVDLPTGMAVSVGVRQGYIQRLDGNYGNCTKDGSGTNFTHSTHSYSTAACRKNCYQLYLIQYCGCVDDILYEDYDVKCDILNSTQQWCRQYIEAQYLDDRLTCSCPSPCNETKYTMTVSSMLWPSERYEEHLLNKITNPKAVRILNDSNLSRKNLIRLKIFYEELNYELVEQVPVYTIPSLLGNIGGLMGLYIGMSFISLFEIIFLVLRVGKILINKICCRTQVQPIKT